MKIKKLLSLMMMIKDEFRFDSPEEVKKEDLMELVGKTYEEVQHLEEYLINQGYDYKAAFPLLPEDTLDVSLKVKDQDGNPISAQVKFFPMDKEATHYSKNHPRIEMILKQADCMGDLVTSLPRYRYVGFEHGTIRIEPIDKYMMEVMKGSEYEVVNTVISLDESPKQSFEILLERLVDLESLGWFAGDLHHHSVYSSPLHGGTDDVIESAQEVMTAMNAMGLSYGALSDHHNILNHKDWLATQTDYFLPLPSKEISTSNGHVMSLNVRKDVIYDIPTKENRTKDYLYHEFVRIVDEIKDNEGLAQINHPKDLQAAISLSADMMKHVEMFDTIEIWNGSVPMFKGTSNYTSYMYWLSLLREDRFVAATTGSDTHNIRANDYHDMVDQILWMTYHLKQLLLESESNMSEERLMVERFIELVESSFEILSVWAKENIGSASVRTYIHTEKPLTPQKVLSALREGKSFLTNGPVLLAHVEGKSYGESLILKEDQESIDVECEFISTRHLESLSVIGKKGILANVKVHGLALNKRHQVTLNIKKEQLEDHDFIVCELKQDHTNMAITNPIFINDCSYDK